MMLSLTLGLTPSPYTRRPSASRRAHPSMAADRCGLLCVGLAGNNGVTLVAGQIANQRRLKWESSRDGPKEANCLGCITQNGALARKHSEFAAFEDVAVGGWDVVPTGLGDALYHSRILEYDLVRQVRDEMNTWPVMPGVFDPDFVGDSQHEGATQVRTDLSSRSAELAALREDIVRFKKEQQVTGHCTVRLPLTSPNQHANPSASRGAGCAAAPTLALSTSHPRPVDHDLTTSHPQPHGGRR